MPEIESEDLENYKAEHLLLLVGGNPLPNAVAAPRLVKASGIVTLLCTKGTKKIGDDYLLPYLKEKLGPNVTVNRFQTLMDDSQQASICDTVSKALALYPGKSVGLHYTAGTKAMAVHAHRVVSGASKNVLPILSYLSARNLRLYFDMANPALGGEEHFISMRADEVSLTAMLGMHGGKLLGGTPRTSVFLPKTTLQLARLNTTNIRSLEPWLDFKDGIYKGQRFKSEQLKKGLFNHLSEAKAKAKQNCRVGSPGYVNEIETYLAALQPIDLSILPPSILGALRTELNVSGNWVDLAANQDAGKIDMISTFYEWVCGKWLECYTLDCLIWANTTEKFGMHEMCTGIEPTYTDFSSVKFELDVLGIKGYQIFGFSCAIERQKNEGEGKVKWKLFEAIMRARQIGGDEARIGFVCLLNADDCRGLENEAANILNETSKIRVFGVGDLRELPDRMATWIKSVDKESRTA